MKGIFYLSALLISYGSLYPFNFMAIENHAGVMHELMSDWNGRSHMGDILGNIILFVSYGYFGMFLPRRHALLKVLISATLLAILLQALQTYLPSRDANIRDVWWNMIGASIGATCALIPVLRADRFIARHPQLEVFPLLIAISWLGYRLMPFVPATEWYQIKDSLKPLLIAPEISLSSVLHDSVAWIIIALIWQHLKPINRSIHLIWLTVPVVFLLEILVIYNSLNLSNVIAVLLGCAVWVLWLHRQPSRMQIVLILLVAMLFANALLPFELRTSSRSFHWIPFYGFLDGQMMRNTAVIFDKFFLFGAALWLLQTQQIRLRNATLIMVTITLIIQATLLLFDRGLAEITDALLVILIAILHNALLRLRQQVLGTSEVTE